MPRTHLLQAERRVGAVSRLRLHGPADLPALRTVRPPTRARSVARLILVLLPALALAFLLVPWQQSAAGRGRVVAYAPADREQDIDAPITGRVAEWLVVEGERVSAGQPLVRLLDNDPDLLPRIAEQRDAARVALDAARDQVVSYAAVLEASEAARALVLAEYDSRIRALERTRVGEEVTRDVSALQRDRLTTLRAEGIASPRDEELAQVSLARASATLEALDLEIDAVRRVREKAGRDADARIASARAELESARSRVADATQKLTALDVQLARQETQVVKAPRDGIVLRVYGGEGGAQIARGQPLITLVPETDSRAVELWVAGNDMPFVQVGAKVRMVFEGWPALQFVGLPGTSRGTFPGRVAFIDSTDDGKGSFRVLIVPDVGGREPWPDTEVLRQGVRAKGWVFLGRVSLGYELWRQLNAFPPEPPSDVKSKPALPSAKKPRVPADLK